MIRNYIKLTWKVLGRNKFFTFISLFGISLTIGILLVVASLFDNMVNPSYPEENRARSLHLMNLKLEDGQGASWIDDATPYFINDFVSKLKTPEAVGMVSKPERHICLSFVGNNKLKLDLRYANQAFWDIYTYDFIEGGPFQQTNIDNRDLVAVISKKTRDEYFGANQPAVGKMIDTDYDRFRVIGVVEDVAKSQTMTYGDLFVPYTTAKGGLDSKHFLGEYIGVLMAPRKRDVKKMEAEYQALIDRLDIPAPTESWQKNLKVFTSETLTLMESIAINIFWGDQKESAARNLRLLIVITILLFLLLPALNLINLNASRIFERSSEVGVRKAFGATPKTLMVQFIVENIILTLLGGLIGLLLAFCILQVVESAEFFQNASLGINFRVFVFGLLLSTFFGVMSGVLPARRMSRLNIVNALNGKIV